MKKVFLIGLAATAMITSCSNDETVEVASQKAIGFETFVDKSTRALNDITNDNIQQFAVWGNYWNDSWVNIFNGTLVSGSYTSEWNYASPQYWQGENQGDYTYYFTAIAPVNATDKPTYSHAFHEVTSTPSDHVVRIIEFNNGDARTATNGLYGAKGQQDLILAWADKEDGKDHINASTKVGLTFRHLLSRVKFTFNNKCGDAWKLSITGLTIKGQDASSPENVAIYKSGTYKTTNASTGNWSNQTDNFDLVFDNQYVYVVNTTDDDGNVVAKLNSSDSTTYTPIEDHRYVIPTGSDDLPLSITFSAIATNIGDQKTTIPSNGAEVTFTATPTITGGFQAGYSYNLTADITLQNLDPSLTKPIEFNVTQVTDWGEWNDVATEPKSE